MAGAFSSGNGDFVTLFEPSATQMEMINEGYIVASIGERCGNIPYTCFSSLKSYQKENSANLKAFCKAIKKGEEYVHTHSETEIAQKIASYFPSTSQEVVSNVVKRYASIDAWSHNLKIEADGFIKLQDIMEMAGELSNRVSYDILVTNDYL